MLTTAQVCFYALGALLMTAIGMVIGIACAIAVLSKK
jgi:hypothetical protein